MAWEGLSQAGGPDPLVALAVVVVMVLAGGLAFIYKMALLQNFGGNRDSRPPEAMTNCPSCGARIPQDYETCEYCGEPATDST